MTPITPLVDGGPLMENPDRTHSSIDALRRHESEQDWEDRTRFVRDLERFAAEDSDIAAWIKAHFDELHG